MQKNSLYYLSIRFFILCSEQMALGKNISNKFDVFTLICTIFAKDKYRDLSAGIRRI